MSEAEKLYRREVVGTFNSAEDLESAISALAGAGWDRAEMSLLGRELWDVVAPNPIRRSSDELAENRTSSRTQVVSHAHMRQTRALAAGIAGAVGALAASGAVMMTGGAALTALIAAAAAGGGAAAAVEAVGQFVDRRHADFIEAQVRRGGIPLWALLHESNEEPVVRDIMMTHGAVAIQVQDFPMDGERTT